MLYLYYLFDSTDSELFIELESAFLQQLLEVELLLIEALVEPFIVFLLHNVLVYGPVKGFLDDAVLTFRLLFHKAVILLADLWVHSFHHACLRTEESGRGIGLLLSRFGSFSLIDVDVNCVGVGGTRVFGR